MKKLLILPLLVLLTSCVTYYYPETALEDGVYYAEDDPSYNVYQGYYPGYAYYPWSSLDYFYIGYQPYPFYAYYYGYGYSPWHYPFGYYGYYPPLFASHYHYPHYPAWYPYSGYCMGYDRCDRGHRGRDENREDRVVGNSKKNRRKRADTGIDENNVPADEFENPNATIYSGAVPYKRYVSTMPSGYSGNQGMVIRSGDSAKVGKSRIQPDKSAPVANGIVIVGEQSQSSVSPPGKVGSGLSSSPINAGKAPVRSSSPRASRSFSTSKSSGSVRGSSRSRSSSPSSGHRTIKSTGTPNRKRD